MANVEHWMSCVNQKRNLKRKKKTRNYGIPILWTKKKETIALRCVSTRLVSSRHINIFWRIFSESNWSIARSYLMDAFDMNANDSRHNRNLRWTMKNHILKIQHQLMRALKALKANVSIFFSLRTVRLKINPFERVIITWCEIDI